MKKRIFTLLLSAAPALPALADEDVVTVTASTNNVEDYEDLYNFSGSTLKMTLKFDCQYTALSYNGEESENEHTETCTLTIPLTAEQAQSFSWRE